MTEKPKPNTTSENRFYYEGNPKLEEVKALIEAKRQSNACDESVVDNIIAYIEEKMKGFTLNKNGRNGIKVLCRNFDNSDVIDAIDISAEKYLKYNSNNEINQDSVEAFIKKIGGILTLKNKPLIDQKIAYVKGICRNRFNYWNDWQGTQILQIYVAALKNCKYSEANILSDFDKEVIPKTKTCNNWSQWRGMMEGWTKQVESWARDLCTRQQEQQPNDQADNESLDAQPVSPEDNLYLEEKRKGGANSYQAYKPLRDKVEELCISELGRTAYSSANQLCSAVAAIIENKHPDLLGTFQPYQNYERDGGDWKRPTFYGWCNSHYKAYKS